MDWDAITHFLLLGLEVVPQIHVGHFLFLFPPCTKQVETGGWWVSNKVKLSDPSPPCPLPGQTS